MVLFSLHIHGLVYIMENGLRVAWDRPPYPFPQRHNLCMIASWMRSASKTVPRFILAAFA